MVRLIISHAVAQLSAQVMSRSAQDRIRTEVTSIGLVPVALLVLLVGLVLLALGAGGGLRRAASWLLLPVSAAWVAFNGRLEGPILLTISRNHGITVSDLLAVAGVLVAVARLTGGRRR